MKYASLLYKANKVIESQNIAPEQTLLITPDKITLGNRVYIPPRTLKVFHEDKADTRIVVGPFGSGKSTSMCFEIVGLAAGMPLCNDGVRRCRVGIFRNSYKQLMQTSIRTWRHWVDFTVHKPNYHLSTPLESQHVFYDKYGKIELEILYINIDSILQIDDLKSLELTHAWLNEGSELPEGVIAVINGRCGRYPSQADINYQPYNARVFMCSNATDEDHWLPKLEREGTEITGNPNSDYRIYELKYEYEGGETLVHIYHQPPALISDTKRGWIPNDYAENIENLGGYKYYYSCLQNGDDFIKVYVLGEWGTVSYNQAVYTNYNDDIHSEHEIDIDPDEPLILGFDFGVESPAILVSQLVDGQLRVIKEFCGRWCSIKELAENGLMPWAAKYARGIPVECVGDPAGTDHGFKQLEEIEIYAERASTNKPESRVDAVKDFLNTLVGGNPKIVISRNGCPKLRQGFLGKYYYRRLQILGEEAYKSVPHKNHPFSDIHDCLQYSCLHVKTSIEAYQEDDFDYDSEISEFDDKTRDKVGGY